MKKLILPVILLIIPPFAAFAGIQYDHTLPDSISWGICFTLLLLIMAYRFSEGPAQLIGAIVLGYWGFQAWVIFGGKPVMMAEPVYKTQLLATLAALTLAFISFLALCKRRRD